MAGVRMWLLSIIAVSLVCALADALMPGGAVKRIGRMVCGLVLMAAVLAPLAGLDAAGGQRWLEDYFSALEQREVELKQEVDGRMKVIIEQEYAAYIMDKAAELGLNCSARVTCRENGDGLFLPHRAEVAGVLPEDGRVQLARIIREDLGIPETEQTYVSEEELP